MKYLIDPTKITNYNLNKNELELHTLFWMLVAGKSAKTIAKSLNALLAKWHRKGYTPFDIIRTIPNLIQELQSHGIGCYNFKAKALHDLVSHNIDLKTCSVEELELIYGCGPKTARCILLHTRANQRLCGLDTHILKFIKDLGYDTPKSTPTGKKYRELEQVFLGLCDNSGYSPAELDLAVWNAYSSKDAVAIQNLIKEFSVLVD